MRRRPITNALRAFAAEHTRRPVGDGHIPTIDGRVVPLPYIIQYALIGRPDGPAWGNHTSGGFFPYQWTVCAARADQADEILDDLTGALFDRVAGGWRHPLVVPGVRVIDRQHGEGDNMPVDGSVGTVMRVVRATFRASPDV